MTNEQIIHLVKERLAGLLAANPEHFLVDVRIKPTNNIKVFLDGDKGIGIDDLVKYNRTLYRQFEEEALFPAGDFSLEISSAGLDEPLKLHRQYVKNTGRDLHITLKDGSVKEGKLMSVTEQGVVLEEVKGKVRAGAAAKEAHAGGTSAKAKKAEIVQHTVLFDDIKTTKILIKF